MMRLINGIFFSESVMWSSVLGKRLEASNYG